MTETWKPVVGSLFYEVSDHGRVRSWISRWGRRKEPLVLSAAINPVSGYPMVNLTLNGRGTTRSVHGLVCESFIGPRPEGMEVRHRNGVADDVRLENLTYGTPKENTADKKRHGTQPLGDGHPHSKLSYLKAKAIRSLYADGSFGYQDIAEVFDVGSGTVRKIINGETWREEDAPQRLAI